MYLEARYIVFPHNNRLLYLCYQARGAVNALCDPRLLRPQDKYQACALTKHSTKKYIRIYHGNCATG